MPRSHAKFVALVVALGGSAVLAAQNASSGSSDVLKFVDPLIGTANGGLIYTQWSRTYSI